MTSKSQFALKLPLPTNILLKLLLIHLCSEGVALISSIIIFRKSGQLVKAFNTGGSAALEIAIAKLGPMMYWGGKGELITRWRLGWFGGILEKKQRLCCFGHDCHDNDDVGQDGVYALEVQEQQGRQNQCR